MVYVFFDQFSCTHKVGFVVRDDRVRLPSSAYEPRVRSQTCVSLQARNTFYVHSYSTVPSLEASTQDFDFEWSKVLDSFVLKRKHIPSRAFVW